MLLVRQAFVRIAQVAVIALRATRQRHLFIAFRAAMIAGRQAQARIAGIAQIARGTFGQAVIIIDRVARRAARPRIATAAGVAAGFRLHFAGLRHRGLLGLRCGWQQDAHENGKAGDQERTIDCGLQAELRMCHGAPSPFSRPGRCPASTSWLAPCGGDYGHWNCVGKAGNRAAQNAAQLSGR